MAIHNHNTLLGGLSHELIEVANPILRRESTG